MEQISVNPLKQQVLYWSVCNLVKVFVNGNKSNRKHLIYTKKYTCRQFSIGLEALLILGTL